MQRWQNLSEWGAVSDRKIGSFSMIRVVIEILVKSKFVVKSALLVKAVEVVTLSTC